METICFYQHRGLPGVPERRGSSYREYADDDRWRLGFVRRAKELGFSLVDIKDLLLGPAQAPAAEEVAQAAAGKLAAVDRRFRELTLLRCRLRQLLRVCENGHGEDCAALRVRVPA